MKHPHDALIRAWLDGHTVQYLERDVIGGDLWRDLDPPHRVAKLPHFYVADQYRLKPFSARVRHALLRQGAASTVGTAVSLEAAALLERADNFVRWLDDWQEIVG